MSAVTASTAQGITHHLAYVNDTRLHYVTAGGADSPVLLVHGFPETWWAYSRVIPILAMSHQVIAVDLRGFGDSSIPFGEPGSDVAAEDLRCLIEHLGLGPVHLVGQGLCGATNFRLACSHPSSVLSFTAIEMGLPGFGLEDLADVSRGGSWHVGALVTPNVPETFFVGREREVLEQLIRPSTWGRQSHVAAAAIAEYSRTFSRAGAWRGASGLYRSVLREGSEIRRLAQSQPLTAPLLAVGAARGALTIETMARAAADSTFTTYVRLEGVGHHVATEAPETLGAEMLKFFGRVDVRRGA